MARERRGRRKRSDRRGIDMMTGREGRDMDPEVDRGIGNAAIDTKSGQDRAIGETRISMNGRGTDRAVGSTSDGKSGLSVVGNGRESAGDRGLVRENIGDGEIQGVDRRMRGMRGGEGES